MPDGVTTGENDRCGPRVLLHRQDFPRSLNIRVMYTACLQVSASVHFHRHSRPPRFIDLLQCLSSIQQEAQLSQKKNHMALSVISSNVLTHRSHQTSDKIVTPIRCLHTFHVKLSFVSYLDIKWPFPLERRLRACWNFIIIFCLSKLRMTKLY